MKRYTEYLILVGIILIGIILRVYFTAESSNFRNDGSFYVIRQVEEIRDTGSPLYNDQLSYDGRSNPFPPGYHYILTIGSIILSKRLAFMILPALFASLASLMVYLISKRLTNNVPISLFSSFISLFIPVYSLRTTNTLSPYSLIIPLTLLCLYLFSKADKKNKNTPIWYVISLCLLSITTASSVIVIGSLLMYVLILKIEGIILDKVKKELIIFSLFFVMWIQFLIYKKALLIHGPYVIWQNIPFELILNYFSEVNILTIIYYVGIIPFLCGMYIIYRYSLKIKNEQMYLYIALTAVIALLLVFRLIELQLGLIYFGFCFVIFFSIFYKQLLIYIGKTKINKYKQWVMPIFFILLLFTSIIPSLAISNNEKGVSTSTTLALEWIQVNTPDTSIILGTIKEGELINSIAERRNIIDENFILIKDINTRVKDIKTVYTSSSLVKAIEILDYYNIDYIFFDSARKTYNIDELLYVNSECFEEVYDEDIKIYKVLCKVETSE